MDQDGNSTSGWRRAVTDLQAMGLVQVLGLLIKVLALFAAPFAFLVFPEELHAAVLAVFLCVIISVAIVLLVTEEFRWHRKARYAEAQNFIHDAHHKLRDAFWELEEGKSDSDVIPHVKAALRAYAAAHSLITGVYCRACIKLLIVDDPSEGSKPRLYVETLCRHDNTPAPARLFDRDYADANSDFWLLIQNPEQRVFVCNDITAVPGYRNSHLPEGSDKHDSLPYLATMVWPIRKMIPSSGDRDEPETLGFLCIDTKSRGVFWKRYDFPVGAGLADALYCFIRRWRDQRGSLDSLVLRRERSNADRKTHGSDYRQLS